MSGADYARSMAVNGAALADDLAKGIASGPKWWVPSLRNRENRLDGLLASCSSRPPSALPYGRGASI